MAEPMKKIESLLTDNNVDVSTLPQKLQKAISHSQKHYADWEQANNELTEASTDDERAEVADLLETVQGFNESIMDAVMNFLDTSNDEPDPTPTPTPDPIPQVTPKEEKKGSSVGWAIFGAIALVVTLGAVNVMKK
jgi:hypothetical protein